MAASLGVCWHSPTSDRWPCGTPTAPAEPVVTGPVTLEGTPLRHGCTGPNCNTQRTVQLSPYSGRRCADHATIPAGPFDRALAEDMCATGRADAALAMLRAWLAREIDARFGAVVLP